MSILVTGGAGFIGSHLVDALVYRGDEVIVLDDLSTGKRDNLVHHLKSKRIRLVEGSVLDRQTVEPLVAKASAVYHLAALVGVERIILNPEKTLTVNIDGVRTILELSRKHGTKVLVASSSEVYGKNNKTPLNEDDDTLLGSTKVNRWAYAVSKLADEYLARAYMKDIPVVIARYFNSYGPRIDVSGYSGVIARFISQALNGSPITIYGEGDYTRSFTYIDDTVAGTLAAADRSKVDVFNIGMPRATTINELAVIVKNLTNSPSIINHQPYPKQLGLFEETHHRLPDVNRAFERLGFMPLVDLHEGLEKTIAWMHESGNIDKRAA